MKKICENYEEISSPIYRPYKVVREKTASRDIRYLIKKAKAEICRTQAERVIMDGNKSS